MTAGEFTLPGSGVLAEAGLRGCLSTFNTPCGSRHSAGGRKGSLQQVCKAFFHIIAKGVIFETSFMFHECHLRVRSFAFAFIMTLFFSLGIICLKALNTSMFKQLEIET